MQHTELAKLSDANIQLSQTNTDPHDSSLSSSFTSLSHLLSSDNNASPNTKRKTLNDRKLAVSGCFNVSPIRSWDRLKLWLGSFPLMAGQHDDSSSVHVAPLEVGKKKLPRQRKREELELEVSMLHKLLGHEQKVHQYLDGLHERHDIASLSIPNFLPQKMKELLAELAMVEIEISRLENQINQLQEEVKHEQKLDFDSKSNVRRGDKKVTFDTKALHFINKAIKGDYNRADDNGFNNEGGIFPKREPKISANLNKSPARVRDPRNPTPRRDRNVESPKDITPKVLSTPLLSPHDNIHRWAPNKLSESITKCLILIFVRLLRTSRAMDIKQSGPTARSSNFSTSFRTSEISTQNPLKTSHVNQRDSRQQDPYGIFDSEESVPRDIGPYKNLVRFTSSCIDMKCIKNSGSVPLFQKLKVLMDGLQKADLRFLSHQQRLAFWINMYNACIMHGFLQYGAPSVSSHEKLLTLINKASLNISGNTIKAQEIEEYILRKPADSLVQEITRKGDQKNNKAMLIQELYGLGESDPNVTFALCCGTRSSPVVNIYTADGVTAELERSKQEYLQAAIVVLNTKKIGIPELLLRNMHHFAQDMESLIQWICQQLPTSGSLRKSIAHIGKASAVVEKIPYEFEFQYLLPIM